MNVAALIPAFNEAGSIAEVVAGVRKAVSHVIVVDDGSTDGTAERARAAGAEVIEHAVNRGKGEAVRTGIGLYALNCALVVLLFWRLHMRLAQVAHELNKTRPAGDQQQAP